MGFPSFLHDTWTLWLPEKVHFSVRAFPSWWWTSCSFVTKRTGSKRSRVMDTLEVYMQMKRNPREETTCQQDLAQFTLCMK